MLDAFERKQDPWRVRLDGWSAWALLRWALAMHLARLPVGPARLGLSRRQRLSLALSDAARWPGLGRRKVLAQSYASALLEEQEGRHKDIWLDDLLARIDSSAKVEQVNNAAFFERRRHAVRPADLTTEFMDAVCSVLLRARPVPAAQDSARELVTLLRAEFGDESPDEPSVARTLSVFYWKKRLWSALLARIAPRVVLVADPGEFGLIAAAKARGALVVEIQHGIIDRYNPSYSWPAGAVQHRPALAVPDWLFVHGEHWRIELAGTGFWGERLRVVGNPRVDLYRGARNSRRAGGTRSLVFTSQGVAVDEAAATLARCARAAQRRAPLNITVKLHPVYDQGSGAYADNLAGLSNVRIIAGNEAPSTFALLAEADLHASISSATHYDAIALGVPTVVLPLAGHETVAPLVAAGHATVAADGEALCALATGPVPPSLTRSISEYYCRPGAADNMLRELAPLLDGPQSR